MERTSSLYDQNDYYSADGKGSRLAPFLNPLLQALDRFKARRLVAKLGVKKGNALDIGAGDGKFLFFLKQVGFNVFGTTASRISGDASLKQFGVALEVSKEIVPALLERKYDLITYWHVYEHLEDPESHVKQWAPLLADNGWLVIEVPNIESYGAEFSYPCWLGSDPVHHINHQPKAEIEKLLDRNGLQIKRSEGFSLKFSYVFLWSALLGLFFGKLYNFDSLLGLLKYPFKSLRRNPLLTINAVASIFYFAPFIVGLILLESLTGRGEVLRLYAQKKV